MLEVVKKEIWDDVREEITHEDNQTKLHDSKHSHILYLILIVFSSSVSFWLCI